MWGIRVQTPGTTICWTDLRVAVSDNKVKSELQHSVNMQIMQSKQEQLEVVQLYIGEEETGRNYPADDDDDLYFIPLHHLFCSWGRSASEPHSTHSLTSRHIIEWLNACRSLRSQDDLLFTMLPASCSSASHNNNGNNHESNRQTVNRQMFQFRLIYHYVVI